MHLAGDLLSFYIKPADGFQLPAIMQWLKQVFAVKFNQADGRSGQRSPGEIFFVFIKRSIAYRSIQRTRDQLKYFGSDVDFPWATPLYSGMGIRPDQNLIYSLGTSSTSQTLFSDK
jgi:hypothetical protein